MADETKGAKYFGSEADRFSAMEDQERLRGEVSPPALTNESGTPHFAKAHPHAHHDLHPYLQGDEERDLRGDAEKMHPGSRGTPGE
jgi:hypothetical protein